MQFPDGVASDDLYMLVGVAPQATTEEIKAGWRAQLVAWHPDRNRSPLATARTQAINGAYDILKDPAMRRQYDRAGLRGSSRRSRPQPQRDAKGPTAADRARWEAHEAEWREREEKWAAEAARERRRGPYYDLEEKIRAAYSPNLAGLRDLRRALALSAQAAKMLPGFVANLQESRSFYREELARQGKQVPDGDSGLLLPIWVGLLLAPVLQDRAALEEIAQAAESVPTAADVREMIKAAWRSLTLEIPAIVTYVRNHPGILQARLGREIGIEQPRVTSHCYWLSEAGVIRRDKAGRSYVLTALT